MRCLRRIGDTRCVTITSRTGASTAPYFEYKPQNELLFLDSLKRSGDVTSLPICRDSDYSNAHNQTSLATLMLHYSKKELKSYTQFRVAGISKASIPLMSRCSLTFWNATKGIISKERCDPLREHLSERYADVYAPRKVMNFATAFLRYLAKTHFDSRYQAFGLFLELPKGLKARKHVTRRIVTKEDVENILLAIGQSYKMRRLMIITTLIIGLWYCLVRLLGSGPKQP